MAEYLGVPVLDLTEPDRAAGIGDRFERRQLESNTQTGIRSFYTPGTVDATLRRLEWACFSRAEALAMREFLLGRRGRALPFWLSAWESDLPLATSYAASDPSIVIAYVGYAALVFPLGAARRHVQIRGNSGAYHQRRITNAVDNGNGTETLTLETSIAEAVTAPGLVTFLRYSRLDADEITVTWTGGQFARVLVPVREIPRETPA